mgnify:CR=1 FL=1
MTQQSVSIVELCIQFDHQVYRGKLQIVPKCIISTYLFIGKKVLQGFPLFYISTCILCNEGLWLPVSNPCPLIGKKASQTLSVLESER